MSHMFVVLYRVDLNADHYGLDKVKERVVEYLAVRKLKNSLKGELLKNTSAFGKI